MVEVVADPCSCPTATARPILIKMTGEQNSSAESTFVCASRVREPLFEAARSGHWQSGLVVAAVAAAHCQLHQQASMCVPTSHIQQIYATTTAEWSHQPLPLLAVLA